MSDAIDSKINDLFNVLNAKKQQVEAAESASTRKWKTNGVFPPVFDSSTRGINIQTQSAPNLIGLLSDLLIRDRAAQEAAEMMGAEYDGKWGGYTIAEWVEDFKTRVAKIQLVTRKAELVDLEKRLDAIVSPEQRRELELEAITKSLSKDL